MEYTNREYPHPVLGIADSVAGEFKVHLRVKSGGESVQTDINDELVNDDLSNLLKEIIQ